MSTEYVPVVNDSRLVVVDSDENIKKRHDGYVKRHNKKIYITFGISYILWIIFYKASLIGGNLNYIKDHLFKIGMLLFISFLFYSVALWCIAFLKIQKRIKVILYIFMGLSLVGAFYYDHGEFFDYHGMYNFMVFCLFIIILDTLSLVLYKWYVFVGLKKFLIQFAIFLVCLSLILFFILRHFINIWGNGFLNKKIENGDKLCKVDRPIPWFDLLPIRQNFWTGSQSCSREEIFDAYFDSQNEKKFTITGCPKDYPMTYMIIPETRNMTYSEKKEHVMREVVNSRMESKVYKYTEPVALPDVEAVLAKCGEQDKLVVRLADRRVKPVKGPQPKDKLNILLIYIDAMGRRQFFRNLPKTQKIMESLHKSGKMHLNQFFRYGVVGFNTNANSLGLFAGVQWIKGKRGLPIWEDYRNNGYVSGETDDHCEDWDRQYNNRTTVSFDHELIAPFCLPEYHDRTGNPHGNFKGAYSILRRCLTGRYVHKYGIDYTKDFIKTYDGTNPWFFRASFIEAHEGTASVLSLMDDDLVDLFESLSDEALDRTAIIMMSDHGLHMGLCFLFTHQGFVEHKLPFLATLIPERFLKEYPELRKNLDDNEQKLISAYDIYATLKDLLNFDINREPHEKDGTGIDVSKAKFVNGKRKRSLEKKLGRLDDWLEDKESFGLYKNYEKRHWEEEKDIHNDHFLTKRNTTDDTVNGTIVWGKSLLRKMDYRKCENILIKPGDCVCN